MRRQKSTHLQDVTLIILKLLKAKRHFHKCLNGCSDQKLPKLKESLIHKLSLSLIKPWIKQKNSKFSNKMNKSKDTILLMSISNLLEKFISNQVYLHKDKLTKKGRHLNIKRKLTFIMRKSVKISIYMVSKENKNFKSSRWWEHNQSHKLIKSIL